VRLRSHVASTLDQAICIRQWDWSETSQTVSLLARELGLIRGIAKGAKRERSKFSGGFEVLTRGEVQAIIKPSAELATLAAWDLQETFPAVRRSLTSYYAGMYMADLVRHALIERDPHPVLFDRLVDALRLLGDPAGDRRAVLRFQWDTLIETGYRPEVRLDILSGIPLAEARTYGFSPRLGGFTMDAAAGEAASGANGTAPTRESEGPVWRVRSETLGILRSLAEGRLASASPEAVDRASRLLASYLREILGRDLPSTAPLFGQLQG
jgi:DNA repair protein RecO (recombination protein O)